MSAIRLFKVIFFPFPTMEFYSLKFLKCCSHELFAFITTLSQILHFSIICTWEKMEMLYCASPDALSRLHQALLEKLKLTMVQFVSFYVRWETNGHHCCQDEFAAPRFPNSISRRICNGFLHVPGSSLIEATCFNAV